LFIVRAFADKSVRVTVRAICLAAAGYKRAPIFYNLGPDRVYGPVWLSHFDRLNTGLKK